MRTISARRLDVIADNGEQGCRGARVEVGRAHSHTACPCATSASNPVLHMSGCFQRNSAAGDEMPRPPQCAHLQQSRSVPAYGFRPADQSGEPTSHRSFPARGVGEALPPSIRRNVTRSALADANDGRDGYTYCDFARALIRIARRLLDAGIGVCGSNDAPDDLAELCYAMGTAVRGRSRGGLRTRR